MSDRLDRELFGSAHDSRRAAHADSPATRRGRHERARRGRRGRTALVLLLSLALVGGAVAVAGSALSPFVSTVKGWVGVGSDDDYPGPGTGQVEVVVAQGHTGEDIATTLRDLGVTKTRSAYLRAASADAQAAAAIQPGTYTLKKQMSGKDAFAILANPANAVKNGVILPEGLWVSETLERLSQSTGVPLADYQQAAADPAALGLPAQAGGNLEGWLFPTAYEFPENSSAAEHLTLMIQRTVTELRALGVAPADDQRVLTIASIVEGEVNAHSDRGKVARVVENRLDNPTGPTVGFLQMDSTRNFALAKRGNLTAADVETAKASPYDTYTHKGLPPGPINSPSRASMAATVTPTPGDWYYFVTVNFDTGETLFAETLAEQEKNIETWRQWCRDNPGKCEGQ